MALQSTQLRSFLEAAILKERHKNDSEINQTVHTTIETETATITTHFLIYVFLSTVAKDLEYKQERHKNDSEINQTGRYIEK